MLTAGCSLKDVPCPGHCQKTLMKLEDQGGPETATLIALKETRCSQMHDSTNIGNSLRKDNISSAATVSHLFNNN